MQTPRPPTSPSTPNHNRKSKRTPVAKTPTYKIAKSPARNIAKSPAKKVTFTDKSSAALAEKPVKTAIPKSPARRTPCKSPANETPPTSTPNSAKLGTATTSAAKEKLADLLEITVTSVMEGVGESKVLASASCKVCELKASVSEATDVLPEKMMLLYKGVELKDDERAISAYGITEDSDVIMSIKMNTGSRAGKPSNAVLYVPPSFPEQNVKELRAKLKTMTNIRSGHNKSNLVHRRAAAAPPRTVSKHSQWTPEKQMEHEITRNRMKTLLRKKRKRILNDSPPRSLGSVECRSVMEPGATSSLDDSTDSKKPFDQRCRTTLTSNELKSYFEPHESIEELEKTRRDMSLPPSNFAELVEVKALREQLLKTECKVCYVKLKAAQQEMPCACGYVFCNRHRNPNQHLCNVDFKQIGRTKIFKENPKVAYHGTRKAKL
ncbi:hypothetical protein Q1695_005225 [Nippostrongylus brasiliensis]|nr:hypothetical protein Q1695_005225 [Nippostrongylus brasiliensis]